MKIDFIYTIIFIICFVILCIICYFTFFNNENMSSTAPPSSEPANPKDTLTLYYTPQCGWSQKFFPTWSQIVSNLNKKVKCTQYNCDENDVECNKMNIPGYPTILLHKEDGSIVMYNGDRSYDDVNKFLDKTTTK